MTPVVVMAGGRGMRLHPLTEHRPKPMLNVGGKPMLETIVERFAAQGFRRIWMCVNYKAGLITEYFGNGEKWGCKIRYVQESEPLGTAGALGLLPEWNAPYIVQNGDVLARLEYGRLMESHARSGADATVCLALHQAQIPYGVVEADETGRMTALREKPIENRYVNAGVYVLNPDVERPRRHCDMPDLLARLEHINCHALEDQDWHDVGTFESYALANAEGIA